MQKIVQEGLKIDLHIHSVISHNKDGSKVSNNTLDNIPLLIQKLSDNNVNMCAITDHDSFSFKMYQALKKAEGEDNSILKVLPAVEFTVSFSIESKVAYPLHIIAIFPDTDEEKIKNIEQVMNDKALTSKADSYKETEFIEILRKINMDTILIAHQKNTLSSLKPRKNDANSVGENKFLEFVYTDYFEAYEFKNKRNQILNKAYLVQKKIGKEISFVTGTDCHNWSVYPKEDINDKTEDYPYTFVKSLPTFKGLVMAVTDLRRLKIVNSFFNADRKVVEKLDIKIKDKEYSIPLSKGINVIIGDNAIGKSMILHCITNYDKKGLSLKTNVKNGYKKYLEKHNINIVTRLVKENIFCFDMQGEVRTKFEENKLKSSEFLSDFFPQKVDPKPYRAIINNEVKRMFDYLQYKFELDNLEKQLSSFMIEIIHNQAESLTFLDGLIKSKKKFKSLSDIISKIKEILVEIKDLKDLNIDRTDLEELEKSINMFNTLRKKYEIRVEAIETENIRIEMIAKIISDVTEEHEKSISDSQKVLSSFTQASQVMGNNVISLIKKSKNLNIYQPSLEETRIPVHENRVYDYVFISKLNLEKISTDYFKERIESLLKVNKSIDWANITETGLEEMLLRYDAEIPVLEFMRKKLEEKFDHDFSDKNSIISNGMDKYEEMSSGFDAKIYFDLLSHEKNREGVYIIDQPEDNISQSAIKNYLLERFKTMGDNRQVLMVTHNPQFIVNLDIDNLIYIHNKDGEIHIQSGALEYSSSEYNVLDLVVENIDGGLETIQKRWKRYEKITDIQNV